jgi:hypothetical protein
MLIAVINFLRLWTGLALFYGVVQWTAPGTEQNELLGLIAFLIATVSFGFAAVLDALRVSRDSQKDHDETKEPRRVINLR